MRAQHSPRVHSATAHLCDEIPWHFAPSYTLTGQSHRASSQLAWRCRGTPIAASVVMQTLRSLACAVAVVGSVAVAAGCTTSSGPDATLRVQNSSHFSIVDLRLTSVGNSSWGPNLLGNNPLDPGESITLGVRCD